jgi:hypothetical protein
LRAEVADLRARQNHEVPLLAAKASATVPPPPAQQEEAVTEAQKIIKSEQSNACIADMLTQKIQGERIDVEWSATASAQIQTAFKTSLPGTEVMDALCASTLCRVVVRHVEKGDQTELAQKMARQRVWQDVVVHERSEAGARRTSAGLSRNAGGRCAGIRPIGFRTEHRQVTTTNGWDQTISEFPYDATVDGVYYRSRANVG